MNPAADGTSTRAPDEHRWQARPGLALALRAALLGVPFVASSAAIWAAGRVVPGRTWWGLVVLLVLGLVVAVVVERGARRLLPVALMLRLSMVFPDQAPSRFALARAAVARQGQAPTGGVRTRTSDLVVHLVTTLGAHDRRTRGHSERVRVLCDMLAAEVGLDPDSRDRLRWAALLHDVGKVEVPASVLNKPGRLDRAEFDVITLHPAAGAGLAAPLLPWLGPWGDGILDHHEKYDGSGYPSGKARDEISLAGRMVGLVDAFETMTAARPYKKAMAVRAAREELARCAGSHFDPALVRAFLAVSLPRVMWAMGPLSFLLQLPFLRPLAHAGARTSAGAPQAAASLAQGAAGAAGAVALVTGGVVGTSVPQQPPQAAQVAALPAPAPAPSAAARRSTGAPALLPSGSAAPSSSAAASSPASSSADPDPVAPDRSGTRAGAAATPTASPRAVLAGPAATAPVAQPARTPAPVGADAAAAPAVSPAGSAGASPAAPSSGSTPPPASTPSPAPPAPGHTVIAAGPPSETSSREASFTLVEGEGWECQLQGNGHGQNSSWRPCSGTFVVQVVRTGDHLLRVRDADSHDLVDAWSWTVTPARAGS